MSGILAGLRVLELGQVLAGPWVGAIFADLGAEVIKIERAEGGDDARRMGPDFRHGDALTFHIMNRGKKSVALDMRTPEGKEALHRLADTADILVHNLRPDVPAALGIDGPAMLARHPRLIYAAISAFGHTGPLAMHPGFEPLIQAYSGLSSLNGGEGDPPLRAAASLCDQGSAMWAVIGTLALLHQREHTGKGGIVGASLLETALLWAGQKIDSYMNTGALPERHRSGHPSLVPYEAFEAEDGPFLICAGNDRLFTKLATALDRADLPDNPNFATNRARLRNKPALFAEICPVLASHPRAHWIAALEAVGVPAAPINDVPEALAQPQVQALGMFQRVPGEDFTLTALPLTFNGDRPHIAHGAPRLGADNALLD
jgi:crotonobetainyl-CoA:carnitine CoA-transferase CaiB-like acyl-CoA transferase